MLLLLLLLVSGSLGVEVQIWPTLMDSVDTVESGPPTNTRTTITLTPQQRFQQMSGFGASMTDSSAYVLHQLRIRNQTAYNEVMIMLFDRERGHGLNGIRLPVAASDYVASDDFYTYNDTPNDVDQDNFSMERESRYLFPILRDAMTINPNITFYASPWSAPAWMKTSNSLIQGDFIASRRNVRSYAIYLLKCMEGYAKEGIHIDYLMLQNEGHYEPEEYIGMILEPPESIILGIEVREVLDANGFHDTKILSLDHNWNLASYVVEELSIAPEVFAGVAWHGYLGNFTAQRQITSNFPNKEQHFTEITEFNWSDGGDQFDADLDWAGTNLYFGSIREGSQSVLEWNLVLDGEGGPTPREDKTMFGMIDIPDSAMSPDDVILRPSFYMAGHHSKFIENGGVRIGHNVQGPLLQLRIMAYENSDSYVVQIQNPSGQTHGNIGLVVGMAGIPLEIPERSLLTIVWPRQ